MEIDSKEFLNPVIMHHCLCLFENEHYSECALTAMKQVEMNLNKKVGIAGYKPAAKTITEMFSDGKGVRLKVPFGEKEQENAKWLFYGAFKYYRNYSAHDGANITKANALRIMMIASELLDLLDVCYLNLDELGGLEEIRRILRVKDDAQLQELLTYLAGQWVPDDAFDGVFEGLYKRGFDDYQFEKVCELGLLYYESKPYEPVDENDILEWSEIGFYRLSDLGKEVIERIEKRVE